MLQKKKKFIIWKHGSLVLLWHLEILVGNIDAFHINDVKQFEVPQVGKQRCKKKENKEQKS